MRERRYILEDGGLSDDRYGWHQLPAEDAGRVAGKRDLERGQHGGGAGEGAGQYGNGPKRRETGFGQPERGRTGSAVDGYVGRAHDQGGGIAPGDRQRDLQRPGQRSGGQDGRGPVAVGSAENLELELR